ncbi:MAG: hypothetical protein A3E36_02975 [Candidatus Andersenbacteria bacterium RIFCSPHIGHO2_12_FULL_45_11b]|uniref:DUF4258 domain-containing protein n=1 Tax=Candidatus Andersenbacteria bacterium RIFCSPHIGHO2_12_FULL_45_11b TaxID=1797282 RepID=A0A1G1XBL9_9BACT|nr:MAG: hypothetical protein A3E36_02975 [Candidatus Andersenbacteria bacterium RIFCSPHIGHO2_12_FULL_45_11b]
MRIQFSRHAEFQMKLRDVSKEIVRTVVRKSEKTTHRDDRTIVAQKKVRWHARDVLCRVIYKKIDKNTIRIITTYITTKIDKYSL